MSLSAVSYLWREPKAAVPFQSGVSLHSHTNQSRETLDFIAELSTDWAALQPLIKFAEDRCTRLSGIMPDYRQGFWTPPLPPLAAFELERKQIEGIDRPALVSITDHDTIKAPELLRSIPAAPEIPVSVEWTVPFGNNVAVSTGSLTQPEKRAETCFHLGIHNLLPAEAGEWMERFRTFTAMPSEGAAGVRRDGILTEMLAALDAMPQVLIVFNHPLWDLYRIGAARHNVLVNEFLVRNGQFLHALELNGLRNWKENREVSELARRWNMLTISGGDRHGIEPNANINLTHATTFAGFVHEVRRERESHVLFMPQYAEPWKYRILQSTLDAVRNHPELPQGMQNWDERVFHPDSTGAIRPISTLWTTGSPTKFVAVILNVVRLLGARPVSRGLRYAWAQNRTEADAKRLALTGVPF